MTDMLIRLPARNRLSISSWARPLKASIAGFGRLLAGVLDLYSRAIRMAYIDPYTLPFDEGSPVRSEGDLEGRQPHW